MSDAGTKRSESTSTLVAAICTSILLLGVTAFFWDLVDMVTPFLAPWLTWAVWLVFGMAVVSSLIHLFTRKRFRNVRGWMPLLIQVCALLISVLVPFTSLLIDLDFKMNMKKRSEVVQKVASNELRPNVEHNRALILLPREYRGLSKGGGEILVEREGDVTKVFFFTFRGILDNFSGFMYRSDDSHPKNGDFMGEFIETKSLRPHWYWVAAH